MADTVNKHHINLICYITKSDILYKYHCMYVLHRNLLVCMYTCMMNDNRSCLSTRVTQIVLHISYVLFVVAVR